MWTVQHLGRLAMTGVLAVFVAGASGMGQAAAAAARDKTPADVSVALTATASAGGTLTYTIMAENHSSSIGADDLTIEVPYNTSALSLQNAEFSSDESWVRSNSGGVIELYMGGLANDDSTTATLRFVQLASGAGLTERASFTWNDKAGDHSGTSNLPSQRGASNTALAVSGGRNLSFSGGQFTPDEPVNLWYNTPSGAVVPVRIEDGAVYTGSYDDKNDDDEDDKTTDYIVADANGSIDLSFDTSSLPAGAYTLVAYGARSGLTAVGAFQVR